MQKLIILLSLLSASFCSHAAAVQPVYRPISPDNSPVRGVGTRFVPVSVPGRVTPPVPSNQPVPIPGAQGAVTPQGQLQAAVPRASRTGALPRALFS